jgi:hypothetical protein
MSLTDTDLRRIGELIDVKLEHQFAEKTALIQEEMRLWRDEFYNKVDPLLKKIVVSREEKVISGSRV